MSSSAPPQPPPKITIYRNGDRHFIGKKLVVNRKYYRSFENFLDKVTTDTRSRFAIRKIHTPAGGTRIGSLEMIKNGAIYVAAGTERFRRIQYGTENTRIASMPSMPTSVLPVSHSKIIATSRYKQEAMAEPLRNRIIFVYRNGEEKTTPVKLLLDKRTLNNMNSVLQYISNKINLTSGAVKSIYSLDSGTKVIDVSEIHTNMTYIAVGSGKQFVKGKYDGSDKLISPRPYKMAGYSNKFNKSKEMKKIENESNVITSHETSVNSDLDTSEVKNLSSIENITNEIDQSISETVNTSVTKSPINDTKSIDKIRGMSHSSPPTFEEVISAEISNDMSGTPPVTPTILNEDDKSSIETNNVDESYTSSPINVGKNDEPVNIENPPLTSSPLLNKEDKDCIDTNLSNELSGTVQINSSGIDNNITEDHNEVSSTETSVEENVDVTGEQLTHNASDIHNDEVSSIESLHSSVEENEHVTEEQPTVYKATGEQKESGEQVKDDKETVVEKLIDMVPAAEVEEDLETNNEVSNFYTH